MTTGVEREQGGRGAAAGKALVVQGNSRSQRGSGAVHKGSVGPERATGDMVGASHAKDLGKGWRDWSRG